MAGRRRRGGAQPAHAGGQRLLGRHHVLARAIADAPHRGGGGLWVVFAVYPLRWAFKANLELQITLWMPIARCGCTKRSRVAASGRSQTGTDVALQTLSSSTSDFFVPDMFVVAVVSALTARDRIRSAVGPLAAGACSLRRSCAGDAAVLPEPRDRGRAGPRRHGPVQCQAS